MILPRLILSVRKQECLLHPRSKAFLRLVAQKVPLPDPHAVFATQCGQVSLCARGPGGDMQINATKALRQGSLTLTGLINELKSTNNQIQIINGELEKV